MIHSLHLLSMPDYLAREACRQQQGPLDRAPLSEGGVTSNLGVQWLMPGCRGGDGGREGWSQGAAGGRIQTAGTSEVTSGPEGEDKGRGGAGSPDKQRVRAFIGRVGGGGVGEGNMQKQHSHL